MTLEPEPSVGTVSLLFIKDWQKDLDRTRSFSKEWNIRGLDDILKNRIGMLEVGVDKGSLHKSGENTLRLQY